VASLGFIRHGKNIPAQTFAASVPAKCLPVSPDKVSHDETLRSSYILLS
jgi:hypothetical protein